MAAAAQGGAGAHGRARQAGPGEGVGGRQAFKEPGRLPRDQRGARGHAAQRHPAPRVFFAGQKAAHIVRGGDGATHGEELEADGGAGGGAAEEGGVGGEGGHAC